MNRIAALVVTIGLGLVGLTTAPGATAAPAHHGHSPHAGYTPPPIAWASCDIFGFAAQCGMLTVPLDYQHPSGTKIQLAVSRVVHTVPDSQYQGVMLVNPGGPGGSGFIYSILGGFVPNNAGAAYDWIGFDPRGVGSSTPSLSCDGNYTDYGRPDYIPFKDSTERAWLDKTSQYADDCEAAGGALLDHVKTTDTAADMESLRKALGRQRINFYGFSYGTYLAQVYATLYPDRVRRMVLDSNVDPRRVWYDANLDQDFAFQKTFDVYFGWLAKYDSVYDLGTTARAVKRVYNTQLRALAVNPADGVFGPDELTDVFTGPAYYVYGWTDVAEAFSALGQPR